MSILTDLRKWPAHKADEIPAAELSKVVKALRTLLSLSAKESVDLSKRATPAVARERRAWYRANYHRAGLDSGNEAKQESDELRESSAGGEEMPEGGVGASSGGVPGQAEDDHLLQGVRGVGVRRLGGLAQRVHDGGVRGVDGLAQGALGDGGGCGQGGRGAGGERRRVYGAGRDDNKFTLSIPELPGLQPGATLNACPTIIAQKFDFVFPGITRYSDARHMLRDLREGQDGANRGRPRRRMSDVGGVPSDVWSSPELGRSALQQGPGPAGGVQQQQSGPHLAPIHPARSHSVHPRYPASLRTGLMRPPPPPVGAPGVLGGEEVETPHESPADSDQGAENNERRKGTRRQRTWRPCESGKKSTNGGSRKPPPGGGNGPPAHGASGGGPSAGGSPSTGGSGGGGGRARSSATSGRSKGASSQTRPAKTPASRTARKRSFTSMVDDEDGDYAPDSDWAGDSASNGSDAEVSDVIDHDGDCVMSEAVPVGVGGAVRPAVKQEPRPSRPSLSSFMEGPPGGRFGMTFAEWEESVRLMAAELNQRDPGLAFRQQTGPFLPVTPTPGALANPCAIVGSLRPCGTPTTPATAAHPTPSRAPPSLGRALRAAVAATPCSGSRSPSPAFPFRGGGGSSLSMAPLRVSHSVEPKTRPGGVRCRL